MKINYDQFKYLIVLFDDYLQSVCRLSVLLCIALGGILCSLFLKIHFILICGFVLLFVFTLMTLSTYFRMFQTAKTYWFHILKQAKLQRCCIPDFSNLFSGNNDSDLGFEVLQYDDDGAIYSDAINKRMQHRDELGVEINQEFHTALRNTLKKHVAVFGPVFVHRLMQSQQQSGMFVNEDKLCLNSDIHPFSRKVSCHKGTYFDTCLTNDSFGWCLKSETTNEILLTTQSAMLLSYTSEGYQLNRIADSCCNNHIGVSTLAVTRDKYLIYYSRETPAGDCVLMPSASGSLDYADLDTDTYLFKKTLIRGIERELCEEAFQGTKALIQKTIVLGYFRWIKRGGKPEFVALTRLNNTLVEVASVNDEGARLISMPFTSFDDLMHSVRGMLINKNHIVSIPMLMCLKTLVMTSDTYHNDNLLGLFRD